MRKRRFRLTHVLASLLTVVMALASVNIITPVKAASQDSSGDGYRYTASTGALEITSNEGTTKWREDRKIITADQANGLNWIPEVKTITLSSDITEIGENAFKLCIGITSITIPKNVTVIKYAAFSNCTALKNVQIAGNVTEIGSAVFYRCEKLTSINLPNSLTIIKPYTFQSCLSLASIIIPGSVNEIGMGVFSGCLNLTSLTMGGATPPSLDTYVFMDTPLNLVITVPKGTKDAYVSAWTNLTNGAKIIKEWTELPDYLGTEATAATLKTKTHEQVTLNAHSAISNETVEYGISKTNDATGCTWQDSEVFTSLKSETTHYFFTRVKATTTHSAGKASAALEVKTEVDPAGKDDEAKLAEAKNKAMDIIEQFVVTNDTLDNELLTSVRAKVQGVEVTWKTTPKLVKATTTSPGSLSGNMVLSIGDKKVEIEVNKAIRTLNGEYSYQVIFGKDSTWKVGNTTELKFTIDGDYEAFKSVSVDGKEVAGDQYTVKKGSTVITLKNDYLKTLKVGKHELKAIFDEKTVVVNFEIIASETPNTGDQSNQTYLILTMLGGAIALIALSQRKRITE